MSHPTFLVIGDPHFKVNNIRETDEMVSNILAQANKIKPDVIVVLGDVLDRHETIHVSPLTRSLKFLSELKEIAKTYVLIGNHDLKNNNQFLSEEHPFSAVKYWGSNITVVDTTIVDVIKDQIFTFVPYVPCGSFIRALEKIGETWKKSSCIFAHQEFKGAKMGAIVSTEGDTWSLTYPFIVSGHIHDYQEPQYNIIYTGTPIQHAFGDRHDKTISYFKFLSVTEREHQRIDLQVRKKFLVNIGCQDVSTYQPRDNCDLKIVINGSSAEIKAIIKHPNIDLWKKHGHKVFYKDIPLNKIATENNYTVSKAPPKFSLIFYQTIQQQPQLLDTYHDVFK